MDVASNMQVGGEQVLEQGLSEAQEPVSARGEHSRDVNQRSDLDFSGTAWPLSSDAAGIPPITYIKATPVIGAPNSIGSEGRFAGYRCPNCGEGGLESIQDALDHCRSSLQVGKAITSTGMVATVIAGTGMGATKEPLGTCDPPDALGGVIRRISSGSGSGRLAPTPRADVENQGTTKEVVSNSCQVATSSPSEPVSISLRPICSPREPLLEDAATAPSYCHASATGCPAPMPPTSCSLDHAEESEEPSQLEPLALRVEFPSSSAPVDSDSSKPKTRIPGY